MDYKQGKWAMQILDHRDAAGMWGNFHTMSRPVSGKAITTEQALRRLHRLGYSAEDPSIQSVLKRMVLCINGIQEIDRYSEKKHDWPFFEKLMLSAWIRIFDPSNPDALAIAAQWAQIAEAAFAGGKYDRDAEIQAFMRWQGRKPKSGFETGFGMFYHAALLPGMLSEKTEQLFLDYYLTRPDGMYYIYDKPLNTPPECFASRTASCYLAALEVLAQYNCAKEKLGFAKAWLYANQDENSQWDFGPKANDGVYFPLSDTWRSVQNRKLDCTRRVTAFLNCL